jgi:hypothetical protein
MDIYIHEPITVYAEKIYQGSSHSRITSMTDVKWMSETRIIAAHRYAGKLYIIDISGGRYKIITTYTHTYKNKLYTTEMFDIDKERKKIYLICFTEMFFIFDILPTDTIVCVKSVQLNTANIPYHGIRLHMNHLFITPSYKNYGIEAIKKYNIHNNCITDINLPDKNIRIKHISILPDNTILLLICYKTDTVMSMLTHYSSGCIRLYSPDFRTILDTYDLPSIHLDSIVSQDYVFYATCRDLTRGFLLKGCICNQKIMEETRFACEDFPHGIDIFGSKIAYTSYTTSGVHIIDDI